ncbi:MAG: insulinase family protein, partial [Rhodothermales bacterium]|nr:insulinase family protein [Rhodothermales bacterium]
MTPKKSKKTAPALVGAAVPDLAEIVRLPNGVRVVVEPVPTVQSVAAGVWVDTGSRDESDAEAGLTHFIEHMVFKGTMKRRAHHIASRMESVGGYL